MGAEAVAQILRGPDQAMDFAMFFEAEVGPQVQRAALLLGSSDQANDVVQESLIGVYQRWETLEQPGART